MLELRDSSVNGHNYFLWLDKPTSMFLHLWDILIFVRVAASALFGTKSLDVDFITSSAPISLFYYDILPLWTLFSVPPNSLFLLLSLCPPSLPVPLVVSLFVGPLYSHLSLSCGPTGHIRGIFTFVRQNRKLTSWAHRTQGGCRTVTMTAGDICILLLLLLLLLIQVLFRGLQATFIKGDDVNRTQCLDEICQPLNAAGQKELRMNEVSPQVVFFLKVLSALK